MIQDTKREQSYYKQGSLVGEYPVIQIHPLTIGKVGHTDRCLFLLLLPSCFFSLLPASLPTTVLFQISTSFTFCFFSLLLASSHHHPQPLRTFLTQQTTARQLGEEGSSSLSFHIGYSPSLPFIVLIRIRGQLQLSTRVIHH